MTPQTSKSATQPDLVVQRLFDAPRERVWKAWTTPALLVRWFSPAGCSMENPSFDVREGGAYACDYRMTDGSIARMRGVYEHLTPPERMIFTHGWADENGVVDHYPRVTVIFEAVGERTRVTVRQTGLADRETFDSHGEGWSEALGHLAVLLDAERH